MKVWQGCLIAFGAFVLLIGVLVGVVFYATGGIVDTADEFFEAAGEGDYPRAYSLTSQQLQRGTSEEQLASFIVDYGLNEVTETSWSSRNMNNNDGKLVGTLTKSNGGEIPIEIDLIYEGEEWKIRFIDVGTSGLQGGGGGGGAASAASVEPMVLPSASDQEDLIFFTTAGFVNALADNDFETWHGRFADGITQQELEQNFASFVQYEREIRSKMATGPNFEPATSLNDNGMLELSGSYGRPGSELRFRYVFTGEGDSEPRLTFVDYELD